jgi:hypothetical protein
MVSTTLTLEASTTTHATDATTGVEIKSGDSTRTLVGMVYCDSVANQFTNTSAKRYVRTWFNDLGITGLAFFSANRTITNTSTAEVNTEIRNNFLVWNGETVLLSCSGTAQINSSNIQNTQLNFNGTVVDSGIANGSNLELGFSLAFNQTGATEGLNYATLNGFVAGTSPTGLYLGSGTVGQRTTLTTFVRH